MGEEQACVLFSEVDIWIEMLWITMEAEKRFATAKVGVSALRILNLHYIIT